jgi:hypothetical protein
MLSAAWALPVCSNGVSWPCAMRRWSAAEYRVPLQGRAAVDLPASVRSVVRTQCSGPDVLAFWRALGFALQHQMIKQGVEFEVEHAGHVVQVGGAPLSLHRCASTPAYG